MNAALARSRRLPVSPYARRLARERGLPLDALRGSGPGGRILAGDVLAFVPLAAPVNLPGNLAPATAPSVVAPRIAAFATSIALAALHEVLAALENTGKKFDIDDILLRAAGRAFAEAPGAARTSEASVALELAGRQAVFSTAAEMNLTALRTTRLAALTDRSDDAEKRAALSLRLLPASDIRPVMVPLLPDRGMRLTVSLDSAGEHADCLLAVDAGSIDETAASAWLAALKSAIENPLRLFV